MHGSNGACWLPHLRTLGRPVHARRLGSSLKANLTYYLAIGLAGVVGVGLLLISGRLHAGDLLPLAMLLANTYGGPRCLTLINLNTCMPYRQTVSS